MQEKVTQKTIALVFKSSRLTADVLKKAMKMYLERRKAGQQATHGKMSVKKLVGQGAGAKSIEVTDDNIKAFERVARKYNVDFAVKRDKTTEPPKYLVFFKGKDADVIAQAFKEFVKVNEKKQQRPSLRQKLKGLQKMIAQNKNRERSREKNKDRGQSL
jgi:alpha-galactosidase